MQDPHRTPPYGVKAVALVDKPCYRCWSKHMVILRKGDIPICQPCMDAASP